MCAGQGGGRVNKTSHARLESTLEQRSHPVTINKLSVGSNSYEDKHQLRQRTVVVCNLESGSQEGLPKG